MRHLSSLPKRIVQAVKREIDRLFSQKPVSLRHVTIDRSIYDIIDFAIANHPREFVAVMEGKIDGDTARISRVLYQPFHSGHSQASVRIDLPMGLSMIGTVHSHPSGTNRPSGQDLLLFGKKGPVHAIICYPYRPEDISFYTRDGGRLTDIRISDE